MTFPVRTPRPDRRPRDAWAWVAACVLGLLLMLASAGPPRSAAAPRGGGTTSIHAHAGEAALPASRAETLRALSALAPGAPRRPPPADGWRTAFAGARSLAELRHAGVHTPRPVRPHGEAVPPRTCERLPYHANPPPAPSPRHA